MDGPSAKSTLNEVWPKPRLPLNEEFLGVITNIDSEGQVYIQTEIGEKVTEGMSKILTEIHSKFPRREDNLKWLPGKVEQILKGSLDSIPSPSVNSNFGRESLLEV